MKRNAADGLFTKLSWLILANVQVQNPLRVAGENQFLVSVRDLHPVHSVDGFLDEFVTQSQIHGIVCAEDDMLWTKESVTAV